MQIGSLNAKLTASDAGFSAALAKATIHVHRFENAVGAVAGVSATLSEKAFNGLSSGITYLSKIAEEADATIKTARAIGITADELSRLQYAGKLAGLTADDVSDALSRMGRTLGDAAEGNKQAIDAVTGLGLNLQTLINESPVDAFGEIADAINKLPTASQKAAAANNLFGRSYAQLMPLLQGGSADMKALADESDRLGITTKHIEAQNIEQFLDAMTRVKETMGGIARSGFSLFIDGLHATYDAMAQYGPLLDTLTDKWLGLGKASNFFQNLPMRGLLGLTGGLMSLGKVWNSLEAAMTMNGAMGTQGGKGAQKVIDANKKLTDGIVSVKDGVMGGVAAADAIAKAQNALDKLHSGSGVAGWNQPAMPISKEELDRIKELNDVIGNLNEELTGLQIGKVGVLAGKLASLGASGEQIQQAIDTFNQIDMTRFSQSVIDAIKTPAESFQEMIDKLQEAVNQGFLTADQAATFATSKITEGGKSQPTASPALLLANSAQAQLFAFNSGKKPVEDQQLAAQKQMVASLQKIERNTDFANDGEYSGL